MTRRGLILASAALAFTAGSPASAMVAHDGAPPADATLVTTPGRFFSPASITVLAGETVVWRNDDNTDHVVAADDDAFESPHIPPGAQYVRAFEHPGVVAYHCALHRFMRGTVTVAGIALSGPAEPLRPGASTSLEGRAPEGTKTVTLERLTPGGRDGSAVATAEPDSTGRFAFAVVADAPASYRARSGDLSSAVVPVQVAPVVRVHARGARRRLVIGVDVAPAEPGARIVLERYVRERFGYVQLATGRLDSGSRARLVVPARRRLRLRVRVSGPVGGFARSTSAPVIVTPR